MRTILTVGSLAFAALIAAPAFADPDEDSLVINDELEMVTETAAPAHMEYMDTIYSGLCINLRNL